MSLLDDVSIVVTPNAYKASKLYAVLPTAVEGSELITNGDFSGGNTGWNPGAGWSIGSGKASVDNASSTPLTQSGLAVIIGKKYNVSFEVSDYVSGGFQFQFGGGQVVAAVSANGVYNFSAISTVNTTVLYLYGTGDCEFKVDNVTCKQDTGADMSVTRATAATRVDENGLVNYAEVLGSELVTNGDFATTSNWSENGGANAWSISGGKANCVAFASGRFFEQDNALATSGAGKNYKVVFTVSNYSQGTLYINVGGYQVGAAVTSNGTHTQYIAVTNASSNDSVYLQSNANTILSVDNISVKEETRNNVPRIDYTGGGCPHILAEPQRTNVLQYSQAIGSNGFSAVGTSIVADQTTSPDGTQNAVLHKEDNSNGSHFMFKDFNLSSGQAYTISIFAKSNGVNRDLKFGDGGLGWSSGFNTTFDLSEGTASSGGVIENFGNGWFRCSVTGTTNATTSRLIVYNTLNGVTSYQGDNSSGVFLYGFQIEAGSYPTSYIPTSGSAVTRNKDQFTRDGIASLIGQTEGSIFLDITRDSLESYTQRVLTLSDGTTNNVIGIQLTSANDITFYVENGGSNQVAITKSNATTSNVSVKIGIAYKANDFVLYIDGTQVGVDSSGSVPATSIIKFSNPVGSLQYVGRVSNLQLYKTRLTNTQLATLTS